MATLLASSAIVAVTSVGLVGYQRTAAQRDQARENLFQALVAQAVQAQVAEARPEAEILAANALLIDPDSPRARGVLAAFGLSERMSLLSERPLPDCLNTRFAEDGSFLICIRPDQIELWETDTMSRRWTAPGGGYAAALAVEAGPLSDRCGSGG